VNKFYPLALSLFLMASPAMASSKKTAPTLNHTDSNSLRNSLDQSLAAFNQGDFKAYLSDLGARVSYNELLVDRSVLQDINQELKTAFPDLKMSYDSVQIRPLGPDEANATTVATFKGKTADYGDTGLAATYEETGEVSSIYNRLGGKWLTHQLDARWDDSAIRIGESFSLLGFSSLPSLMGAKENYRFRLYIGDDERDNVTVSEAYALVPLASVIDKAQSQAVMDGLKFQPLNTKGLDVEMSAPAKPGTYVHLLVINKTIKEGTHEVPLGEQIYNRLVRVED
jgi:hypothetical protein